MRTKRYGWWGDSHFLGWFSTRTSFWPDLWRKHSSHRIQNLLCMVREVSKDVRPESETRIRNVFRIFIFFLVVVDLSFWLTLPWWWWLGGCLMGQTDCLWSIAGIPRNDGGLNKLPCLVKVVNMKRMFAPK